MTQRVSKESHQTAVLVLGMHRSGTSLLSGLIAKAGITIGDSVMSAAADNPKGYWENERIVHLNERILNSMNLTWSSWHPLPAAWEKSSAMQDYREEIEQTLVTEFSESSIFCIKDPRLCRLMPLWQICLDALNISVCVIAISRNINEVTGSLTLRDSMGPANAEALWLRYNLDLLALGRKLPGFHISYAELMDDPAASLDRLGALTGQSLKVTDSEFVDKTLRHHDSPDHATPRWALELEKKLAQFPSRKDQKFEQLIFPPIAALAEAEKRYSEVIEQPASIEAREISSARERVLFDQMQEAKLYAQSLVEELKVREATCQALSSELEIKARQLEESLAHASGLEEHVSAVEKQNQVSQERLESALTESLSHAEGLAKQLAAVEKQNQAHQENLQNQVTAKDQDLVELRDQVTAKDQDLVELRNRLQKLEAALATSLEHADSQSMLIEQRVSELAERADYVESLQRALAEKEAELEEIRSFLQQKEADLLTAVSGHERDINLKEEYAASLQAAITTLTSELEQTQQQLAEELEKFKLARKLSNLITGSGKNRE